MLSLAVALRELSVQCGTCQHFSAAAPCGGGRAWGAFPSPTSQIPWGLSVAFPLPATTDLIKPFNNLLWSAGDIIQQISRSNRLFLNGAIYYSSKRSLAPRSPTLARWPSPWETPNKLPRNLLISLNTAGPEDMLGGEFQFRLDTKGFVSICNGR